MDVHARIQALKFVNDTVAPFALFKMMSYLTKVWGLNIMLAAGIINLWTGLSKILQIFFAFLADAFFGSFFIIFLTNFAYIIGLCGLWYTTPQVFSRFNNGSVCNEDRPECIGDTQKILFFISLVLITIGQSGTGASTDAFRLQQRNGEVGIPQGESCWSAIFRYSVALILVVAIITLQFELSFAITFGLPIVCSLVITLYFLGGLCSYETEAATGSPLTIIFRVIVASLSKVFYKHPQDGDELYQDVDSHVDQSSRLRFLNKASIVLPGRELNRWRICTVFEVEETKAVLFMIPIFVNFVVCGLVSSIGNTYFQEQATNMNQHIGSWKTPVEHLLTVYKIASITFEMFQKTPAGSAQSLFYSAFCCIIAGIAEFVRLHAVGNLPDGTPDEQNVHMSMYWLIPQFVLLAAVDKCYQEGLSSFIKKNAPVSLGCYSREFTEGVQGLGIGLSTVSVYVVGHLSKLGGNQNWFQGTINKSRLDYYYWVLAGLSVLCLVFHVWVIKPWYPIQEPRSLAQYYVIKHRNGELSSRMRWDLLNKCIAKDFTRAEVYMIQSAQIRFFAVDSDLLGQLIEREYDE